MSKVVLLGLYGWVSIQIALRLFDLVRCKSALSADHAGLAGPQAASLPVK